MNDEIGQLERTIWCINQIGDRKQRIVREGTGDCRYCLPDQERNPHCSSYHPITVRITHLTLEGQEREIYALDEFKQGLED